MNYFIIVTILSCFQIIIGYKFCQTCHVMKIKDFYIYHSMIYNE